VTVAGAAARMPDTVAQDHPYGDRVAYLPTWAIWVLSFGTALLAFAGVLLGQAITRRGTRELEIRSKREEVMRILRWAAELAVADDQAHVRLGVTQLGTLLTSDLLDEEEKDFVQAALTAVVEPAVQQIEQLGEGVQVIAESDLSGNARVDVPSQGEAEGEGGDG
jgi:hypothetical protein